MSCAIYEASERLSYNLGISKEQSNKLINELLNTGLLTKADIEGDDIIKILDLARKKLDGKFDVDATFEDCKPVGSLSYENFKGEIGRSRRANAYIGADRVGAKNFKTKLKSAYAAAGKTIIDDSSEVNENTVALVEITTESDIHKVAALCRKVLDAGGRILLPTQTEIDTYAKSIQNDKTRDKYETIHKQLDNALELAGASSRTATDFDGRIIQKTENQVFEKLNFGSNTKVGKLVALNEGVDEKTVRAKAKPWNIKIGSTFTSKDGASTKADGVKSDDLFDAIVAGEVDSIAKRDTEDQTYSQLKQGDIIPLKHPTKGVLFVEVVDVRTGVSKDQYVEMIKNGTVNTGFSALSASNMKDYGDTNIIKIKPLYKGAAEESTTKEQKGKSKSKKGGSKHKEGSGNGRYVNRLCYRYSKKKHKYVYWTEKVWVENTTEANQNEAVNKLAEVLLKALVKEGKTVEKLEPSTSGQAAKDNLVSAQQKLAEAKKLNKGESLAAREFGYASDVSTWFAGTHYFSKRYRAKEDALLAAFNGRRSLVDSLAKGASSFFRSQAEQYVIPGKIEAYKKAKASLEDLISKGINEDGIKATKKEIGKMKKRIKTLNEKIQILETDGWLGAVRIKDVLSATLADTIDILRDAARLSKEIREEMDLDASLSFEDAARKVSQERHRVNFDDIFFRNIVKCDVTRTPFTEVLFDGDFERTDSEQAKLDNKNGDAEAISARQARTEEASNAIKENDNLIKKRRANARAVRQLFYEEIAKRLTEASQIKMDLRILEKKVKDEDGIGTPEITVDFDVEEGEKVDYDDAEAYEESGRDSFMLNPDTVGISESLTNETRRILGSLYSYKVTTKVFDPGDVNSQKEASAWLKKLKDEFGYADEDLKVERIRNGNIMKITAFAKMTDAYFDEGIMVPAGVARCNILDVFLKANEGRGLRTGDEFYDYIKKHEAETPWYHALNLELEKSPAVRTRFFNAFRKANKPARSLLDAKRSGEFNDANESYSKYISWAENYDEKAEWVLDKIQTQTGNGLVIQRGDAGKSVRPVSITQDLSNGDKEVYRGENIEFGDISIYNENGQWNEGSIEYTEEKGKTGNGKVAHIKNITKATGAYGFCLFVRSNLNKDFVSNSLKSYLAEEMTKEGGSKEITFMLQALNAVGVPCSREGLVETYTLHPEMWSKTIEALYEFTRAYGVSPMERTASFNASVALKNKYVFSHLSTIYKTLSDSLTGLGKNSVDASYRWGSESRYSVQNRSIFHDILSNICAISRSGDETDAKRVDEEVKQYLTDKFLQIGNGKYENVDMSFFATKNSDGSIEILNPILRALMPSDDPSRNRLSRIYRRMLSTYHWNLGISADKNSDNVAYASLSACQKMLIDVMAHFSPVTNRNEDLGHAIRESGDSVNSNNVLDDKSGYHGVCFACFPIAAESNNHVHIAMPRKSTQRGDKTGNVWNGLWIDAHRNGSLLDNCADVVMQEFNRIRVYASEYANGRKLSRPDMYKVFQKNELRYCNFTGLNDTFVVVNGQELDFTRAIEYILTTSDNIDSDNIVVYKKNERGEVTSAQHKVYTHDGIELSRDVIMTAVHQLCLNELFDSAMKEWDELGLFDLEYDKRKKEYVGYKYLQAQGGEAQKGKGNAASNDVFKKAYDNAKFKLYAGNALVAQMLGVPVNSVYQGDVSLVKGTDGQYVINRTEFYLGGAPAFTQFFHDLMNYENAAAGIKKGDVIDYILNMRDRNFGMDIIKAQVEDKNTLIEKYKNIAAFILEKSMTGISDEKQRDNIKYAIQDSYAYRNLLMEAMQDFAFNKTINKAMLLQLFVGDLAQFKDEGDLSKRFKAIFAAYERCDLSARDGLHLDEEGKPRLVKEWYGETRITEEKWQNNQKTITLKDFTSEVSKDGSGRSVGYVGLSQFFNEEIFPKLKRDLQSGVITRQEYNDFCDAYSNMNMTDGQSFRTIESMKKICDFLGLTTPGMNDIYNAVVVEGKLLSWEQIRDFMQQMKTVSYGFQNIDVQYSGKALTEEEKAAVKHYRQQFADFTKDSQFTLMFYSQAMKDYVDGHSSIVGGRESIMCGIHKFCTENQVDVVHFMSTKKTGQYNVIDLTQCKNADEAYSVLKGLAEKAAKDPTGASDVFHAESWDNVGRQVVVHEHIEDVQQGIGTQIDKLIGSDLEPFWQATETYIDENGETRFRKTKPIKTTIALRDDDGKVLRRLDIDYFIELLNRVKITNMIEDYKKLEEFLSDKQKFSEFLLDQLELTNKYAEDVKNAVRLNDDGDFNLPLDTPQVIRAIAPIIASVIRKRVIKQKTKGGTAVQFSSVGRTKALREVTAIDEESGQPYVEYIECLLPEWSKELFSAFADENGDIDLDKVPNHLKEMVGYRVPTEYMYSMVPLRVVGFLPKEMGGSIMLPQEITVWSGSDFDIDKMFLEMCEFTTIKKGSINEKSKAWAEFYEQNPDLRPKIDEYWAEEIQIDYDSEEDPERKLELYSLLDYVKNHHVSAGDFLEGGRTKFTQAELSDAFKQMRTAFAEYRKEWSEKNKKGKGRVLDVLGDEDYERVLHSFQVFIEENGYWNEQVTTDGGEDLLISSTQEEIEKASRMARNNLLVRLHFARLTSDHTFMKMNTPGGFENVKKMSRIMRLLESGETVVDPATGRIMGFDELMQAPSDKIGALAEKYSKTLDILNPSSDDVMFERNMSGKTSVGIYALHNSYHSVMQNAKIHLSNEFKNQYPIILNGQALDEVGSVRAADGSFIIRNIGSLLAASVDNAKDPVLGDLYLNSLTADYALTLMHLGYSLQTAVLFMNQPIIKQLFKDFARSGEPWYMFNTYYTGKAKDLVFNPEIALTDQSMADAIDSLTPQRLSVSELKKDKQQMNALAMLKHVMAVTKAIKNSMDAVKITSPKNNMANSYGECYMRQRAIRKSEYANTYYKNIDDKNGISIFDHEEYTGLVLDAQVSNDVMLKSVDEYIKSSRLPFVQAAYDLGFRYPLHFLSKYIGTYSPDTDACVEKLNNLFPNAKARNLNGDLVQKLAHERMVFMTINQLVFENREWTDSGLQNRSVSEARRAYLTSFPKYFTEILQNYQKYGSMSEADGQARGSKGIDLQKKYAILSHIVCEPNKNKSFNLEKIPSFLKFTKNGGKVDATIQNEITDSWANLYYSEDPVLQDLAINLFIYSMFYNGCDFSPVTFGQYCPMCVISEFPSYTETLRHSFVGGMSEQEKERFVHQFVLNHADEMRKRHLIGVYETEDSQVKWIADMCLSIEDTEETYGKDGKVITKKEKVIKLKEKFFDVDTSYNITNQHYICLVLDDRDPISKGVLFRRSEHPIGAGSKYRYEYVEPLGDGSFVDYDSTKDVVEHTPLGYLGYDTLVKRRGENDAAQAKSELLAKRRQKQLDELAKLTEFAHRVTDDRNSDSHNDSEHYILDDETENKTVGTRVHSFAAKYLNVRDHSKPPMYTFSGSVTEFSDEGKPVGTKKVDEKTPIMSQEAWDSLGVIGTNIGSSIDRFFRLYLKKQDPKVGLTEEEKAEYANFDGPKGFFAKNGIDVSDFSINLYESRAMELGKYVYQMSPLERLEEVALDMIANLHLQDEIVEGGRVVRYADRLITEIDGLPIRVFANVTINGEQVPLGGELDFIIMRGDGTWEIGDWKTMNRLCALTMLDESSREQGKDPVAGLSRVKNPQTDEDRAERGKYLGYVERYSEYKKYLNTYRAILLNAIPGMEITRLFLSNLTVERKPNIKAESAVITSMKYTSVYSSSHLYEMINTPEVKIDESLIGIQIPHPTIKQEEEDEEESELDDKANGVSDETEDTESGGENSSIASDGYSSYKEIFEKILGIDVSSSRSLENMVSVLDRGLYSDYNTQQLKMDTEMGQGYSDEEIRREAMERRNKYFNNPETLRTGLTVLLRKKYGDSVVNDVFNAVINHKQITDDTHTPLCK